MLFRRTDECLPRRIADITNHRPAPTSLDDLLKAYDIRGRLGAELNIDIACRIGRAFAGSLRARRVVVGRDCRASSETLMAAVIEGLLAVGVEVYEPGLCGTEELYFATTQLDACGGIEVTASHNPMDYNGMKMVGRGSAPLDPATDMAAIRALAESGAFSPRRPGGFVVNASGARGLC